MNKIGNEGIKSLGEPLTINTSLKELDLSGLKKVEKGNK